MTTDNHITVALCGNPNSGKSSIFNQLTGLRQKITNIPGTTIERKKGWCKVGNQNIEIVDTPGTYSIDAKSKDEEIALEIFQKDSPERPDLILYVADTNNLKRNLLFFSQLQKSGIPTILVLNMLDVATYKGIEIDFDRFEKELGIRIVATNARVGDGIDQLKEETLKPQFVSHYPFYEGSSDEKLVNQYQQINN